jgi:hypothetical protein
MQSMSAAARTPAVLRRKPQVTGPMGIGLLGALVFLLDILSLVILLGWRDRGPASR